MINCIIENYLFRDSQIVSTFQGQISEYVRLNCRGTLSKATWEIVYFLCSGLFSRSDVTVSDIYSSIAVSKSAVIRYLNRLEMWGIIDKRPDPKDKRRRILKFTPKFEQVVTTSVDQCVGFLVEHDHTNSSTGQIVMEDTLHDRLGRFKDFAEVSSDWLWETDKDHRFSWFSESHWIYLELGKNSKIGVRRWDYHRATSVHERQQMERHREDIDAGRPFRDFVYRMVLENGNELWCAINGNPVYDEDGNFQGYIGTGRDVTSRREIVESLRKSEDQLRRVVNLAADYSWVLDKNYRYVWFAKGCRPLIHRSEKEVLGSLFWEHFAPVDDRGREMMTEIQSIFQAHRPFHDFVSRTVIGPDWNVRWYLSSGVPIFDDNGNFEGYQGVCRDTTEHIQREWSHITHKKVLQAIVDGEPTHVIIQRALNLFERLRPGTEVALFIRTDDRFYLFDEINSEPGRWGNSTTGLIADILERSQTEPSRMPEQASATNRAEVEPTYLAGLGEPRTDAGGCWVLPLSYADGAYNGAIAVCMGSSDELGLAEKRWLDDVRQMLELILVQAPTTSIQNVN